MQGLQQRLLPNIPAERLLDDQAAGKKLTDKAGSTAIMQPETSQMAK